MKRFVRTKWKEGEVQMGEIMNMVRTDVTETRGEEERADESFIGDVVFRSLFTSSGRSVVSMLMYMWRRVGD